MKLAMKLGNPAMYVHPVNLSNLIGGQNNLMNLPLEKIIIIIKNDNIDH